MATHPSLADLATAVADLTPIDWPAVEAGATTPADRAALARLRLLDRIVRACADIARPDEATNAGPAADAPATWGAFTIQDRIGGGTFGDVYRAHDRRLDRIVALKLLRPDREGPDAVGSEAIDEGRLLAKVRHPNVVTVYGAERIDGRVGVWMELVEGKTLEAELREKGPLQPAAIIEIGLALCGALRAVHQAGLIHRDLKAQNVLRAHDGRLLLTDFGAGRVLAEMHADARRELAGTPLYLAPEVLAGQPPSVTSELYGLGVLLYHLATGSFPVRGRTLGELRHAHAAGRRVSLRACGTKVPGALSSAIDRLIDPDPARRFASIAVVERALRRAMSAGRRRKMALGGVVAIVLIVAANLAWSRFGPGAGPVRILERRPLNLSRFHVWAEPVAAADGRLYYAERGGRLYSIALDGTGSPKPELLDPVVFEVASRHPVRQEFLAMKRDSGSPMELWALPLASGQPYRLADLACHDAAWSADGSQIACATLDRILIASPDGSTVRALDPPDPAAHVVWSPDGRRLRFTVLAMDQGLARAQLWEIGVDGSGLRPLLPGWQPWPKEMNGAWTPGGRHYVFRSGSDEPTDLWELAERRNWFDWRPQKPVRLTEPPEHYLQIIAGSRADTLLATMRIPKGELVRLDASTGRLEPYLNGLSATWVSFSPDRQSLAYVSFPDKKLWRARVDGSERRQLAVGPFEVDGAFWSPDGRWISFLSRMGGARRKNFLIPADGGTPEPISRDDREQGIATWSPDSTRLVFGDVPNEYGRPDGHEVLHFYDLRTRELSDMPGSAGLWTSRWSPDGRWLAAVKIDGLRLMLYEFRTGSWRETGATIVEHMTWSTDSRFLYFHTSGQESWLRRVRLSDGHITDVLRLNSVGLASGDWIGLSPDNRPIMLRDVGTWDIVELRIGRR